MIAADGHVRDRHRRGRARDAPGALTPRARERSTRMPRPSPRARAAASARITYARGMPHDVVISAADTTASPPPPTSPAPARSCCSSSATTTSAAPPCRPQAFEGVDARLSRYSYLVSLLPAAHHRRPRARRPARASPLLVVHARPGRPLARPARRPRGRRRGIRRRLRARRRRGRRRRLGRRSTPRPRVLAERLFPTLTEPLPTRAEARELVGDDRVWADFVERPLGERHRRALRERPRARRRRDRRPHRHLHRPRRPRRSTPTAASSTT